MHLLTTLLLATTAVANPIKHIKAATKPVYWLLAGDSTTAPAGGWGDAFLSTTVAKGSSGHNYGHSGATTKSFRDGGDWGNVIKDIGTNKGKYDVWVTIQFGHNDQKATSGVTIDQFKANLATFAKEVTTAGGTPILVTSLTRRRFNANGTVTENLVDVSTATRVVAGSQNVNWIDLNAASTKYVNAIGADAAAKYNLAADDYTHLNTWGGVVFARMVSDLIVEKYPAFKDVTVANQTLSATIKAGKPA
ncbi:carbohydrate esterase family 12 protein [Lentithecium fluviatile CBS 122367]|uniref:Carbohydrate esterase family 12 protein n=1 Tax=Lentithecium fluviatile CBS 122367 TaxID=1168545 RepID=A0A6G1IH75_9PLEO|nr:carbohydrate esterase family 12 protein [Lentithecium fluviatile CBS 122367]